uniref:Uncharacterized protein n=1 Tax=Anguilla anguilla TaxID=7936 RepID=A0A0E9WZH7_ANGAN
MTHFIIDVTYSTLAVTWPHCDSKQHCHLLSPWVYKQLMIGYRLGISQPGMGMKLFAESSTEKINNSVKILDSLKKGRSRRLYIIVEGINTTGPKEHCIRNHPVTELNFL